MSGLTVRGSSTGNVDFSDATAIEKQIPSTKASQAPASVAAFAALQQSPHNANLAGAYVNALVSEAVKQGATIKDLDALHSAASAALQGLGITDPGELQADITSADGLLPQE